MPKVLVVAVATFVMLSPAFANPSYEAEWGLGTYPSPVSVTSSHKGP
jgi:hypothetical protein